MKWIDRHLLFSMVAPVVPFVSGLAFLIGRESEDFSRAGLFFVCASLLWMAFAGFLLIPLVRRIDVALKATARRSVKSLLLGEFVGLSVLAFWMISLIGLGSAYLGGPQFSSLPCSLFTSFTLTHILGGIVVVLPFGAIAGVFRLADARSRSLEISGGVRTRSEHAQVPGHGPF